MNSKVRTSISPAKCYLPIGKKEKTCIAGFIGKLAAVATQNMHPMCRIARWQTALAIWRWTADAVETDSKFVIKDAGKYNFSLQIASRAAIKHGRKHGINGLRHEHAVPRQQLADKIISEKMTDTQIVNFLNKFCVAVIVTKDEDSLLRPRNEMPDAWIWDKKDIFRRYLGSHLFESLVCPENMPS